MKKYIFLNSEYEIFCVYAFDAYRDKLIDKEKLYTDLRDLRKRYYP